MQAWRSATLLKWDSNTVVFLFYCQNLKNTYFEKTYASIYFCRTNLIKFSFVGSGKFAPGKLFNSFRCSFSICSFSMPPGNMRKLEVTGHRKEFSVKLGQRRVCQFIVHLSINRSSLPEVFCKFTGKHLWQNLFF